MVVVIQIQTVQHSDSVHESFECRPLCRNLGSRVHFLVKVILIDFHLEKYMQCKEKMFTIFSCSINVVVTSQNGVPSFHLHQRAYMWCEHIHT